MRQSDCGGFASPAKGLHDVILLKERKQVCVWCSWYAYQAVAEFFDRPFLEGDARTIVDLCVDQVVCDLQFLWYVCMIN